MQRMHATVAAWLPRGKRGRECSKGRSDIADNVNQVGACIDTAYGLREYENDRNAFIHNSCEAHASITLGERPAKQHDDSDESSGAGSENASNTTLRVRPDTDECGAERRGQRPRTTRCRCLAGCWNRVEYDDDDLMCGTCFRSARTVRLRRASADASAATI